MLFSEMGLSPEILKGISDLGFEQPTPIQEKVIPVLMEQSRDIIGLAQTGTGKTAAFGLPALGKIDIASNYPQFLILSPTRELCMQITRDLENYSKYINGMRIVAVYGGAPIDKQISSLKRGAHVVVATPGRICDLIKRRRIELNNVSMLVLDEADEMLKMGFREDVDAILAETPKSKTTLLFSATMSSDIAQIAKNYMSNTMEITVGQKNASADSVHHIYYMVQARDRYMALKRVVDFFPDIYGIVFCRTRMETKDVAASLMKDGYNAEALHGDLTQSQRDYVMQKFRERNLSVLVATDVAARGLDVTDLTHVINYNLPDDPENYNHRSGRTGRAGKEGTAVSIINLKEKGKLKQIEKVIRKQFEYKEVPSGKEICERQLFKMIDKVKTSEVNHKQIDPYMAKAYEMLSDFPKEELIKRFVSAEFSRFLEYYKNAIDINLDPKARSSETRSFEGRRSEGRRSEGGRSEGRRSEGSRSDEGRTSRFRKGQSMSRVVFNIGKGKEITKKEIIDLMVAASGRNDLEIGQIEIFNRASSVEIDSKFSKKLISDLNRRDFKGVTIEAEENYEFIGNDFRDRNKGPRGKKKRY